MKSRYCPAAFWIGAILWWIADIVLTVPSDQYGHLILVILVPPLAWFFQFFAGVVLLFTNTAFGVVVLIFNLTPFWFMGIVYVVTPRRYSSGLETVPALEDGQA